MFSVVVRRGVSKRESERRATLECRATLWGVRQVEACGGGVEMRGGTHDLERRATLESRTTCLVVRLSVMVRGGCGPGRD